MKVLKNAMVRKPSRNLAQGLSTAGLGPPIYEKALAQHVAYIAALQCCGLVVTILEEDDRFPDSVFIEDTAIVCENTAVITRPGAPSRRGEEKAVAEALRRFYNRPENIVAPGTLEGGDEERRGQDQDEPRFLRDSHGCSCYSGPKILSMKRYL
ncbi:MAG: arginine deiminase-related protein [Candidatus Aminicenantes bacterium]|nr:arginine deiminase-related protein [Candidatus Aminicenantes bacterium]